MGDHSPVVRLGVEQAEVVGLLTEAVDHAAQGIVLVDSQMRVRLVNAKARTLWHLSDEQCSGSPIFADFIYNIAAAGAYDLKDEQLADYVMRRFEMVETGDTTPIEILLTDGRTIRAVVTPLPSGGRMVSHTDVSDLVSRATRAEQQDSRDTLTTLLNMRGFEKSADIEWRRFKRHHAPFSIAVFNINRLSRINRDYGHDAGDRAIIHVSSVARRETRSTDILARIDADRFVVLMPETGLEGAKTLADRLAWSVMHDPLYVDGAKVPLSVRASAAEANEEFPDVPAIVAAAESAGMQEGSGNTLPAPAR